MNELNERIEKNFTYHSPKTDGQKADYEVIRNKAKELAYVLDGSCHPSRELSLAMTKLEEVVSWANASIARNGAE